MKKIFVETFTQAFTDRDYYINILYNDVNKVISCSKIVFYERGLRFDFVYSILSGQISKKYEKMIYERLFDIGLGMKRSERDNSSFTKMKPSKKLRASKQNSCL